METQSGKKVLIVGFGANAYSVAEKMSATEGIAEVFVAPGNDAMKDFSTTLDIREGNVEELLEFVLENAIDLTVVVSKAAIKNNIVSIFQQNNQMIFAPAKNSANICLSNASGKKFMYKTGISCPKFGIFDKQALAIEYVKKSNMPVVIKTDEYQEKSILVCNSFQEAKTFIEELFENGEKKVIIDDYISGHDFSFYVITDGYQALPLGSVATYKYELEGNGGFLTEGMGAYTPDYKISEKLEKIILEKIVYPALNLLADEQMPYVGILGVDLVLTDAEKLFTLKFNSFLNTPDCQCILTLLNENIYNLFQACVVGSFADDYEKIDMSDKYAVSCVISSGKEDSIIEGLDNLDDNIKIAHFNTTKNKYLEYETRKGRNIVLTSTARVLSKAVENLYDELAVINFYGIKYRKDIARM